MKRILILGCGYVGRAFAIEALQKGYQVVAITRNVETVAELSQLGCQAHTSMAESEDWHSYAEGAFELAINCVSSAGNGLDGYRQSYLGGNQSFATWLTRTEVVTAVFTSSVSVYADSQGEWVNESDANPSNERGKIMIEAEKILLGAAVPNTRKCVLRLGGIYGPDRHMLLNKMRSGPLEIAGYGDYYLNLIRLEDICSSIWSIANCKELSERSIFNVVDDEPVLKEELVNWFAEQLGHTHPKFSPELSTTNSSRRFADEAPKPSNRKISNQSLKKLYGWSPRFSNFKEGFDAFLK